MSYVVHHSLAANIHEYLMVQVGHLLGNLQRRQRVDAVFADRLHTKITENPSIKRRTVRHFTTHVRRSQQHLDAPAPRVEILTRQQPDQLRRGPMLGRQQVRTARDGLQKVDRIVPQLSVLLKVLKVLRAPVTARIVVSCENGGILNRLASALRRMHTTIVRHRCRRRDHLPHHVQHAHRRRRTDHRVVALERFRRLVARIAGRRCGDGERRRRRRCAAPVCAVASSQAVAVDCIEWVCVCMRACSRVRVFCVCK